MIPWSDEDAVSQFSERQTNTRQRHSGTNDLNPLRELLPAFLLRSIGEAIDKATIEMERAFHSINPRTEELVERLVHVANANRNAEANGINVSDNPPHTEEEGQIQAVDRDARLNRHLSHLTYYSADSSPRDQAHASPPQVEILPETPVNRVLFTDEGSGEDTPSPNSENHVLSATPNPENAEYEVRDVMAIEEAGEVAVKMEPQLLEIEDDDGQQESGEEPSSDTSNEDAVDTANNDALSAERDQRGPRGNFAQSVVMGRSQGPLSTCRMRGAKRTHSDVETGYWLRSRKPSPPSKRSRRTTYWLRPER